MSGIKKEKKWWIFFGSMAIVIVLATIIGASVSYSTNSKTSSCMETGCPPGKFCKEHICEQIENCECPAGKTCSENGECVESCQNFVCPDGTKNISNSQQLCSAEGCTFKHCCEQMTCDQFQGSCTTIPNTVLKSSTAECFNCEESECCQPKTCAFFTGNCPENYERKASNVPCVGDGGECSVYTCCEELPSCNNFKCKPGSELKTSPENIRCESSYCEQYECCDVNVSCDDIQQPSNTIKSGLECVLDTPCDTNFCYIPPARIYAETIPAFSTYREINGGYMFSNKISVSNSSQYYFIPVSNQKKNNFFVFTKSIGWWVCDPGSGALGMSTSKVQNIAQVELVPITGKLNMYFIANTTGIYTGKFLSKQRTLIIEEPNETLYFADGNLNERPTTRLEFFFDPLPKFL